MTELDVLRPLIGSEDPITWVMTGDSITHGLRHTNGGRSYPEHMHEIIRNELDRRRDIVVNTAISGHRITDILDDFTHRVGRWSPQVVSIMIGTNDCAIIDGQPYVEPAAFAEHLKTFIFRVQAIGGVCVVHTPPPVDVGGAPNRARLVEFADVVRSLTPAAGAILVDQYEHFLALGGDRFPWALLDDPFHPGALGHAALAVETARVLGFGEDLPTLVRLRAELAARGLQRGEE